MFGPVFGSFRCAVLLGALSCPSAFLPPMAGLVGQDARSASETLRDQRRTAIVEAADRVAPAVVSITVARRAPVPASTAWDAIFLPPGRTRLAMGFGSGVIVRKDGIVITNSHVIDDAVRIRASLGDGRDFEAELVGTDELTDIAALRLLVPGASGQDPGSVPTGSFGRELPVAPVGTARGLLIGEWVVAIGNPIGSHVAGSEPSVSAGVVSATGRNIYPTPESRGFHLGMIQTDAAINPGNSGGPLVNVLGQVVGINSSILSHGGGSDGLGFAIPIDRAMRVAEDLMARGEVRRAWLGIEVSSVAADEWGSKRVVRVTAVAPGSPAAGSGIAPGDHILAANSRALRTVLDLDSVLLDLRPGEALSLEVERLGNVETVVSESPLATAERITILNELQVITVTEQIGWERDIASPYGALITAISTGLARALGLRAGDVILQVHRTRVTNAAELRDVFNALRGPLRVPIYFERDKARYVKEFYWRG